MPNHTTHPTLVALAQLREGILDNLHDICADPLFSVDEVAPEMALVAALGTVLQHGDAVLAYLP